MTEANSSYYAKFRCAIALAWIDGEFNEKEREILLKFIENGGRLSDEQKANLKKDLNQKISLEDVWKDVTNIYDKAHLLDIADVIFKSDANYSEAERLCYDKMKSEHFAAIDHDALKFDIEINRVRTQEREKAIAEIENLRTVGRLAPIFGIGLYG